MKAILIDDEQLALDFLERQIKKISTLHIKAKLLYFDMNEHKNLLYKVDVVFLDIEMPEINGIELAEMMLEENPGLSIIFVTAYNDYALKAFELNALDYVLKPVRLERLQATIERIENRSNYLFSQTIKRDQPLRVNVCKELTFQLENNERLQIKWRTAKARELFLFLLHHEGKTKHKSELIELLWEDFDQEKAYSQLYTAIYHIRKTLRPYTNYFTLKNTLEGYHLTTTNVFIDIYEWEKQIKEAEKIQTDSLDAYEEIMELYTGSYLQDYNYLWAEAERFRLEQIWLSHAHNIASFYKKWKYPEKAEAWYVRICTLRPEDEEAHFYLMQLYASMGYGILVRHQYKQLQNAIDEFHISISPHIQQWYKKWSREEVPNYTV
ncbi:response regulator [Virgibacillus sp. W0430]|uniref:response regulator n=1 Tax=Virgibacillus sp. W0430 TaxID=3391580 RepID=UPI003F458FA1